MDGAQIDRIARLLARAGSRRALALAVPGIAASGVAGNLAAAKRRRRRCGRDDRRCGKHSGQQGGPCRRCCSSHAVHTSDALIPTSRRRCACRPDGMPCGKDGQCCNGVCDAATKMCEDGEPGGAPLTCSTSVNLCQQGAQNCGDSDKCWCVTTNSDEMFCTNGSFNCASNFGENVTCESDNDCFNRYGETTACVSTEGCGSSVPCSGSGGTVCAQICAT